MKYIIFSACMLILILSFTPSVSAEGNNGNLLSIFANAQTEAVTDVLTCFREGAPSKEWGSAIQDLVRAEIGMINCDYSYKSDELYSYLAKGLSPIQYPLFGFKVFEKRLNNAGYKFSAVDKPFSGQHLLHFSNSYDKSVKIEFK